MHHSNILSIEGVAPTLFKLCTVSLWMENEDMQNYITKCPGANRLELVCPVVPMTLSYCTHRMQLIGVTRGLDYLHDNDIIHGDLKSVRRSPAAPLLD